LTTEKVPGGYNGKILRVNLSSSRISTENIDDVFCRKYLGGSGFITYFLLKELKKGVDPLGPDNKLIFALGPVTGTAMIGGGRNAVGTKSPLSGCIALSEVGESWGAELKRAGYDAIIVEGKAEKPAYLWVHDGEASLRDAGHLWGKNTKETQGTIRAELGDDKIRLAQIGPGGEKMVRFACIMNGLCAAAGRGGTGAVMGSKNLKAVAVRGHKAPRVADPERLREMVKWMRENLAASPRFKELGELGTGGASLEMSMLEGNLPVRNFRDGLFEGIDNIAGRIMKETMWDGTDGCFACPVRCKKRVKFDEPYPVDPDYGGPEYETVAALGSDCGVDNLKAVVKGAELCNAYSLDTISTGGVIAFAMECFERGLLSTRDTGGIELKFGNDEAMLKCIELIARREGFGDLLANGSAWLARRIGNQSEDFAIHVKGVEAGQHEPRLKPGLGLGFMVDPHGADHVLNMVMNYDNEMMMKPLRPLGLLEVLHGDDIGPRKVALFKLVQLKTEVVNCLVTCAFMPLDYQQIAELTSIVTGWDTGVVEQLRVAERILTMARLFNIQQGFTADDDVLPKRFFQPKTDGVLADKPLDPEKMEKAKRYYYTLMGWDAGTGIPLPEKLEELGITYP
jgi:aldehyde:ferredoxin oxidoreductase